MHYIYLIVAFCLNAIANIVLKVSATSEQKVSIDVFSGGALLNLVKEKYLFIIGILLFALNVVFYYASLRTIPLSIGYPIMVTMSVVIINSYAYFFLRESITALQIVGYVAIVIGISMVFLGSKI